MPGNKPLRETIEEMSTPAFPPGFYIVLGADGVLPSDMVKAEDELEEERRLLYVAMTRARDVLYVTFPLKYYHRNHPTGDSYSTAQLTRFLPPSLFRLFVRAGGFCVAETCR